MKNHHRFILVTAIALAVMLSVSGSAFAASAQGSVSFPVTLTPCLTGDDTISSGPCDVATSLIYINQIAPIIPVTSLQSLNKIAASVLPIFSLNGFNGSSLRSINQIAPSVPVTSLRAVNEIAVNVLPVFSWNGFVATNLRSINNNNQLDLYLPIFRWNGFSASP